MVDGNLDTSVLTRENGAVELIVCICGEVCTESTIRAHGRECLTLAREVAKRRAKTKDHLDWMSKGACQGKDPELFFTDDSAILTTPMLQAKAVCHGCPVRTKCLRFACAPFDCQVCGKTHPGMEFGIYGGSLSREREAFGFRFAALNQMVKEQMSEMEEQTA